MARSARVEVAPSGRSSCVHCGKLIARGDHRLVIEAPSRSVPRPEFFHRACALKTNPRLSKAALAAAGLPIELEPELVANATLAPDVRAALDARPHDEATRRVYADWLEGQGNPLGRFITATLEGREKEAQQLHKAHRADWLGGVSPNAFVWARGLVQAVTLNAREPAELARRVTEVLALPACACVESLTLPGPIDAAVYAAISRSAPRALTELSALLAPGLDQLALPSLTGLTLLYERTAAALALDATRLPALRRLHLAKHWNRGALDEQELAEVRDLPISRQLTELTFIPNLIDPDVAQPFAQGDSPFARAVRRALGHR